MSNSGVKIEVHLIQNFAPSNLNRDDTGQPKSAYFGGFRRARVSSQCEKRAVREWWRVNGSVPIGMRTKKLQQLILSKLLEDKAFSEKLPQADLEEGVRLFTDAYYAASDKTNKEKTNVLLFMGPMEVEVCAQIVKELWDDPTPQNDGDKKQRKHAVLGINSLLVQARKTLAKKGAKQDDVTSICDGMDDSESGQHDGEDNKDTDDSKKGKVQLKTREDIKNRINEAQISADIALFGRMLAEQPGRNTDGACQVAHPISTHKVDMEMDFFTAVDDLNPGEDTGAGMMGVIGFNSACFYRYALVDRDQLARNLARKTDRKAGDWVQEITKQDYKEADQVICEFLKAMVYAIPTAKQNSFAAQNLPSFGLLVRRQGGVPISLANAFAKPVRSARGDDDLIGLSVERLTRHWDTIRSVYGDQGIQKTSCFHVGQDSRLNSLNDSDKGSVEQAITSIMEATEAQ